MDIGIILITLVVIFIAELPDKSLFAALVLGSKFPGRIVWAGAAAAFLVHVIIAVTAGQLLTLLPHILTESVIALLFFAGAGLILFGKHGLEDEPEAPHLTAKQIHNPWKVFATAFSVVFIGELGDITQITTANYAARYHDALSVGVGATLGLWLVAALGIGFGNRILKRIPARTLQLVTGIILFGFGVHSLVQIF